MKKLIALLMIVLMLPAAAFAEETTVTANAVAQSAAVYQVTAPYSGVLKTFDWETGDLIGADELLFEMDTIKVYAPVDGTVRAVFAEEGDQAASVLGQYGMLAAIEKVNPQVVNATTTGAYNKPENRVVHVGETVYLEESYDTDNKGQGRVIAVSGDSYVVELNSGVFDDNVNISLYRDANCGSKSCIGSGRIDTAAEVGVSATGYVLDCAVQQGDSVKKGDLLFELAAQDAENTLKSAQLTAPVQGAVELAVTSGMQVYKGQLLAKIHDLSDIEVVASVDEMDLDRVEAGDSITIAFDRYPDSEVTGTVTHISRIGLPKQNATYYDVVISVTTNLEVLPGMNAVVYLD